MKNPLQPKVRAGLLKRMELDGCRTFSDKVRWVEKHIPEVDDPASFVGSLVGGRPEAKTMPKHRYQVVKGRQVVALSTTKREAEVEARRVGGRVVALAANPYKDKGALSSETSFATWAKGSFLTRSA